MKLNSFFRWGGLAVTQLVLIGCGNGTLDVSRESVDFDWPFTVSEGRIECRKQREIVFVSGGTIYGLNGTAQSAGYPSVDPIWLDNPDIPGTKISVGPMISLGSDLC